MDDATLTTGGGVFEGHEAYSTDSNTIFDAIYQD